MKIETLLTIIHNFRQDRAFRNKALIVMVLTVLYILIIPGLLWERSEGITLSTRKAKYNEFATLTGEYRSLKEGINAIERKKTLTKTNSIAKAIGDISQSLGIEGKVKSIKGTGTRTVPGQMSEETAEIQTEKIDMGEMIQLIYKMENAPMILAIKKVVIKKSFENPELLDVTVTVSLFTSAAVS
jgi:hypothetical protein